MNQLVKLLRDIASSGDTANLLRVKLSEEALESLRNEVALAKPNVLDMQLYCILRNITVAEHLKVACDVLAKSGSLRLMEHAVDMNPNLSKQCADDVMVCARKHLMTPDNAEDAQRAQTLLEYAQVWYTGAGALTAELQAEIQRGLSTTAWVNQ